MKLSYQWLQDYLDLPETPKVVANLITTHVAEVEQVENQADQFVHIVVGEVLAVTVHPTADKLNIGQFNVGEEKPRQIVFGGKAELKVGDRLPVALPGAVIGPITITERKLRNETSRGMCCLNSELDILDGAEKVHLFPETVAPGTPIADALGLNDSIITIDNKTLTHRPDLFCHIGFARELSVILDRPLKLAALAELEPAETLPLTVLVDEVAQCRRYIGAAFTNVTVAESPDWLQHRLRAIGLRPINNVVDITNYVMYEYGQPLHAFDYDKMADHTVHVRFATPKEIITTLDGKAHTLSEKNLVIADAKKAQAVAGIMGGAASEISAITKTIVLESANFNPTTIRQGAQALGMRTDGSTRHEKNLSWYFPKYGFLRAAQLLQDLTGATIASPITDSQPLAPVATVIALDLGYVRRLSGVEFKAECVVKLLEGLSCAVKTGQAPDSWLVTPPNHRTDLHIPEELIEEVARLHGYDAVPTRPLTAPLEPQPQEPIWQLGNLVMQHLVAAGADEVMAYSFYSEAAAQAAGLAVAAHLRMLNPMNPDQLLLRQTQKISLRAMAEQNWQRRFKNFVLAEYGHVYLSDREEQRVALYVVAANDQAFYQAKGYIEAVLKALGGKIKVNYTAAGEANYEISGTPVATVLPEPWTDGSAAYAEIWLTKLLPLWQPNLVFTSLPNYPGIELDISIAVAENKRFAEIRQCIIRAGKGLIQEVTVFDVFRGKGVPLGQTALGLRLFLQAADRTLTMDEAEKLRNNVISELSVKFGALHRY